MLGSLVRDDQHEALSGRSALVLTSNIPAMPPNVTSAGRSPWLVLERSNGHK